MMIVELRKILTSWIIWALAIGTILLSMWATTQNAHHIPQLQILTDMVAQYGAPITEESLAGWERLHQEKMTALNAELSEEFKTVAELRESLYETQTDIWNLLPEQMDLYWDARLVEDYLIRATAADEIYQAIDLRSFGENLIEQSRFQGNLPQIIRQNFAHHQENFQTMREQGGHRYFFFNNDFHAMHNQLFGRTLAVATLGLSLVVALSSAFILNYEFDQRSFGLIYTTKKGRKLQWLKLGTALIATTLFTILIMVPVLAHYFMTYDYAGLWHIPLSSLFYASEGFFFLVPRYAMTFSHYLLAFMAVVYLTQLLFAALIFSVSNALRNGYLVPIAFFMLAAFGIFYFHFVPASSLLYYLGFNPFRMMNDVSRLFMIFSVSQTNPHYEVITLVIWTAISIFSGIFTFWKFNKIDL